MKDFYKNISKHLTKKQRRYCEVHKNRLLIYPNRTKFKNKVTKLKYTCCYSLSEVRRTLHDMKLYY